MLFLSSNFVTAEKTISFIGTLEKKCLKANSKQLLQRMLCTDIDDLLWNNIGRYWH
jgi:hypothetical protein